MKRQIQVKTHPGELRILYSPDWEYYDYGGCKRHSQILFPYQAGAARDYPLILFISGSAWHRQKMNNDIPPVCCFGRIGVHGGSNGIPGIRSCAFSDLGPI